MSYTVYKPINTHIFSWSLRRRKRRWQQRDEFRVQLWHHSVPLALLAMISPLLIDRTQNPRTLHNLLTPSYYNYCYYILINFSFHILLASFTLRLKALFIFFTYLMFFFFTNHPLIFCTVVFYCTETRLYGVILLITGVFVDFYLYVFVICLFILHCFIWRVSLIIND